MTRTLPGVGGVEWLNPQPIAGELLDHGLMLFCSAINPTAGNRRSAMARS
jgi:hypothetical protein